MYRISFFVAAIFVICGLILVSTRGNQASPLPKPPELRARDHELSLTLHAVADSNGRNSFAYKGHDVAPILRVSPGDTLKIEYVNDLPAKAQGSCAPTRADHFARFSSRLLTRTGGGAFEPL